MTASAGQLTAVLRRSGAQQQLHAGEVLSCGRGERAPAEALPGTDEDGALSWVVSQWAACAGARVRRLGVLTADDTVSTQALLVLHARGGWRVVNASQDAVLATQRWGHPASTLDPGSDTLMRDEQLAVWIPGQQGEHLLTLTGTSAQLPRQASTLPDLRGRVTRTRSIGGELREVVDADDVRTVVTTYAEHLAWPPRRSPRVRQLRGGGEDLDAVRKNLERLIAQMERFGFHTTSRGASANAHLVPWLIERGVITWEQAAALLADSWTRTDERMQR